MFRIIKLPQLNKVGSSFEYFQRLIMSTGESVNNIVDENAEESKKRPLNPGDENVEAERETKVPKFERIKKRNYALMLSYLGKDYYGMQRNPQMRTIEEDLISALFKAKLIDKEAHETIQNNHFQRAARTDKGVSANRQICSIKLPEHAKLEDINEHLPKQIRVFSLRRVTKGFNSKSNCNARTYIYTFPTYALAFEDPSMAQNNSDEEKDQRFKQLQTIDGKPYEEYRVTPEIIEKLNSILKLYEGSHNFHNFTSKVRPFDPRAMRYIINCQCNAPYISGNTEFVTILIKGQSFMLHQIRKMVGLAIGIVRNLATEEAIAQSYKHEKMDIPIAPSLGLVLNYVHYDNYNRRYGSDGLHEKMTWEECEKDVEKFHKNFILRHIEDTECNDRSMLQWLSDLTRCKFAQKIELRKEEDEERVHNGEEEEEEEKSETAVQ